MMLKDSQRFMRQAGGKKSVQTAAVGLCIAALVGAAAGFSLAVKLGKHKREIESGYRPTAPNSDGAADDAPDEAGKPEGEDAPQSSIREKGGNSVRKTNFNEGS